MKSVSVIIPAFNAEKYIEEAVNSVKEQSYSASEIIVINDGSTDGTADRINAISGIRCIHQENRGIGKTLNVGLNLALGELLAFLDADDLWVANKLEKQVALLEKMDSTGIVFGQVEQFISADIDSSLKDRLETPKKYLPGVHRSAMLIDSGSMNKAGPFSEAFVSGEFLEWFMRAKDQGIPVQVTDQLVVKRRIHGSNITLGNKRKESNEFPLIVKQALDRRRKKE